MTTLEVFGDEQRAHLSALMLRKMGRFQQRGKYCDVVVRVGCGRFRCHRAVLAAASPFFEVMFSGGLKESGEAEVPIEHIEGVPPGELAGTFQLLIDFIYNSDQFQISLDNCMNLMYTGNYFQVPYLMHVRVI